MARKNRMQTQVENPAKLNFSWSSKNQLFSYYDRDKKENVLVKFPFKFLAISQYVTVTGWNQKHKFSIRSNEVRDNVDHLDVWAYYNNGNARELIGQGSWSDIKDVMEQKKGKWTQSVYAMVPDGSIINLKISGGALTTWFDFQKKQTGRFMNDWIEVNKCEGAVNGDVDYTFPVFEWSTSLDEDSQKLADTADALIEEFEAGYFPPKPEPVKEVQRERSAVDKYEMESNKHLIPPSDVAAQLDMIDEINASVQEQEDDLPF